jgi:hypothetical protein
MLALIAFSTSSFSLSMSKLFSEDVQPKTIISINKKGNLFMGMVLINN